MMPYELDCATRKCVFRTRNSKALDRPANDFNLIYLGLCSKSLGLSIQLVCKRLSGGLDRTTWIRRLT